MSTAAPEQLWDESKAAPHGRDPETNEPLIPYGKNRDGSPRKGKRGGKPGVRMGAAARGRRPRAGVKSGSQSDRDRKAALVALTDMLIVTPLAGLSASPQIAARFGEKQTDALAGDAVIVSEFAPNVADGLIVLSQSKPGALAWLDSVEEKAPYLMLASVGLAMAKALTENHLHPNPDLAKAGRLMAQMKAQAMADQIMAEAQRMGVDMSQPQSANGSEPTIPIPQPV